MATQDCVELNVVRAIRRRG